MLRASFASAFSHIGLALREPETFALRWHRGETSYAAPIWLALSLTAIAGTTFYGMTMGMGHGAYEVLAKAALLTLSAGLAWAIPLPALYVLNSLSGSKLRASTTLLAALVTTSWGGLALIASIPINWFFSVAMSDLPAFEGVPGRAIVFFVNVLVFGGVGLSMVDVFGRVVEQLEPAFGRRPIWFLGLVGAIGAQLFILFNLFRF